MPRSEPSRHPEPHDGGPLDGIVKVRRGPDGRLVIDRAQQPRTTTTEAAERPPQAEDPRPAAWRDVPPFGGAA